MPKYCSFCGNPLEENIIFCPHCGTKIVSSDSPQTESSAMKNYIQDSTLPPEADSIISLNHVAGILSILLGCIFLIIGIITLIVFIGIFLIVFGVIDIYVWNKLKEINYLLRKKNYQQAKNEQLTGAIIGLFLGGIIIGIILLISYMKYDELIRLEHR